MIERDTDGGPATQIVEHTYDYLNRWVAREVDSDGDGPLGFEDTYFVYDGTPGAVSLDRAAVTTDQVGQIILHFEDDAQGNPQLAHRYLWGDAVDQILADEQVTDLLVEGEVLWALTDHLGTVRDLAQYDPATSTTTVVNHRAFSAFGELISETNCAIDHLFAFTGRALDQSTSLQNNLNRWYDATVGRWISQDPIGLEAGDANVSRYVGNSPTDLIDPSGLVIVSGPVPGIGPRVYEGDPLWDQVGALWDYLRRGDITGAIRSQIAYHSGASDPVPLTGIVANALYPWMRERGIRLDPNAARRGAELARQINAGALFTPIAGAATVGTQTTIVGAEGSRVVSQFCAGRGITVNGALVPGLQAPSRVALAAGAARNILGSNYRVITNKAGDTILLSQDATRRIRFDINRPAPHTNPHMHVEELVNGKWQGKRIYPTDVAPE